MWAPWEPWARGPMRPSDNSYVRDERVASRLSGAIDLIVYVVLFATWRH